MYHLVNMDHPYFDNPPNVQQHCEFMTININSLISEVETRSVLWDRNNLYYSDRVMKRAAWQEVFKALNPNFDQLPKLQQLLFGNAIERRWKSLREGFSKRVRCERQSNQGHRMTPYMYNHQLDFLRKAIVFKSTGTPMSDEDCVVDSQSSSKSSTLEEKLVQFLEAQSQKERDYHQKFFDSLLPMVRKLDDDQALSFRSQVLRLLQEIPSSSADPSGQERCEEPPDNSMSGYSGTYQLQQDSAPEQTFDHPLTDQSAYVSQGPSSSCDSGIESPVCASSLIQSAVCVTLNMQTSNLEL